MIDISDMPFLLTWWKDMGETSKKAKALFSGVMDRTMSEGWPSPVGKERT